MVVADTHELDHTAASFVDVSDVDRSFVELSDVDTELSGRVVDGDGAPLNDAVIMLIDTAGQEVGRARAAADGSFSLELPGAGRHLLLATAEGYQPVIDLMEPGRVRSRRDIVLERLNSGVSGVIKDRRFGRPVAGACVALTDSRGVVVKRLVTGADGRYDFPALPTGSYSIVVSGQPPAASSATLPAGQRTELDLTLAD